jgi:mannose-6-phosphate isomerase
MSAHHPVDTLESSPSSKLQCELLYATSRFQVRLWHFTPGQQVAAFPQANNPNEKIEESQCLVVSGNLSVSGNQGVFQPQKGERFVLPPENSTLSCQSMVQLLELRWGQNLEAAPLREITEERPWGSFTVLKDEPAYKMKQLSVKPGNRLSLQRHFKREEHWLITQGQPEVTLDDVIHRLKPGDYIHIPLQSWHRVTNPEGATDAVEIIELQLGDYFGEDDIERAQDDYGRR